MSGFDDNPFADPFANATVRSATQPGVGDGADAAGGVSVAAATGGPAAVPTDLDEYNPFDSQSPVAAMTTTTTTTSAVAGAEPGLDGAPLPGYSVMGQQQQLPISDLQRRQEELDRKAAELERREEALRQGGVAGGYQPQNNWPPLPSFVPFQPCFYQDICVDIPSTFQLLVRRLYQTWCLHAAILLVNVVGALAALIQFGDISLFGLALVFAFLFTPASYVCWFRPVYKAFQRDSSINFMVFFFVYFFQLLGSVIQAMGIPGLGTCGFVNGAQSARKGGAGSVFVGVIMILIGISFSIIALIDLYLISQVHRVYRSSSSASFSKAQQEFTSGVLSSDTVRQATADIASSAVRSQMPASAQRY